MTFGEVLHKLQSESGLTQAQVAQRINMDQGNYCRLLKADDMTQIVSFALSRK